jgi:hypothetical protein
MQRLRALPENDEQGVSFMSNQTKKVVVRPEPITVLEGFSDQDLPSEVALEIDASVPDKYLADAALDIFHRTYAISVLQYLDIAVYYEDEEIFPAVEFEDGRFEQYGKVA